MILTKVVCVLHKIGLLSSNNGHSIPSLIKVFKASQSRGFFMPEIQ